MSKVKGFIVSGDYRVEDENAYVYLFGRLEDGRSFITKNHYRPYFFIKKSDVDTAKKILKNYNFVFSFEDTDFKDPEDFSVVKIVTNIPKNIPKLREILEDNGIVHYEADIKFVRRFLMDFDIKGTLFIEGDCVKKFNVDCFFDNPKLYKDRSYKAVKLKTVSIDIETSKDSKELYTIGLVFDNGKKYSLIVSDEKVDGSLNFSSEKDLLLKFNEIILSEDPDVITGWNIIDFDFKILRDFYKKNKISMNLGRIDWKVEMKIFSDFLKTSTVDIPGRQVLDGIVLLKNNFISLEDYTLQTASEVLLGKSKIFTEKDRGKSITSSYENDKKLLVEYNLNDAILVLEIINKLKLLDLTIERSLMSGLFLDEVRGSISTLDSMYLRKLHKDWKKVYYTAKHSVRESRIKGGFVMQSSPGLYDYVLVFDFTSLYPSIIATFNIDPLTYVKEELVKNNKVDCNSDDFIVAPNNACFRKDPFGILPELVVNILSLRKKAKKEKDDVKSFVLKTTMNSFYGVLANPNCRFYNFNVANAITHFGQFLIKKVQMLLKDKGFEVIYGDTDSIFVNVNVDNVKDAELKGKEIQSIVKSFLEKLVFEEFKVKRNFLDLKFEKLYVKFWMPTIRNSEEGSKKRYAGLLYKDGKEVMDIVGLEYVRRDWTDAAREFQYSLLKILFSNGDVKSFIKKFVSDLKEGKLDDKLIYRKALRKDLDEYTKTTPPHVKAARLLDKLDSNIVKYYMTINGPEPVEKLKSKIDYSHYIEKQIKPLANAILHTINLDFDDIVNGKQKSLFDF